MVKKYFEITLEEAKRWTIKDYILFIIETTYATILPFFAGVIFATKKQFFWFLLLILPIYVKLNLSKPTNQKKTKKIYIK